MFFGTIALYNSVPASMLSEGYIIPYFLVIGLLIYLTGVKFAYNGQIQDATLPKDIKDKKDNVM